MPIGDTTLQRLLDDACLGGASGYDQLLMRACERLGFLAKKRLKDFPALRRWVETDDVLQNAMLRLSSLSWRNKARYRQGFLRIGGSANPA